jgi:hypothetical protein
VRERERDRERESARERNVAKLGKWTRMGEKEFAWMCVKASVHNWVLKVQKCKRNSNHAELMHCPNVDLVSCCHCNLDQF